MAAHQQKNVATERHHLRPGKKSPSGTSKTPGFTFFVRFHFLRPVSLSSPGFTFFARFHFLRPLALFCARSYYLHPA